MWPYFTIIFSPQKFQFKFLFHKLQIFSYELCVYFHEFEQIITILKFLCIISTFMDDFQTIFASVCILMAIFGQFFMFFHDMKKNFFFQK